MLLTLHLTGSSLSNLDFVIAIKRIIFIISFIILLKLLSWLMALAESVSQDSNKYYYNIIAINLDQ